MTTVQATRVRDAGTFFGRTILIVDDERDICDSLKSFMEAQFPGIRALTATRASTALEKIQENRVDVALVDYRMPNVEGFELLREIREVRPDVPSVLITAFPDFNLVAEAWNESLANGFLTKPVDPNRLRDVIERLLARRAGNIDRFPPNERFPSR